MVSAITLYIKQFNQLVEEYTCVMVDRKFHFDLSIRSLFNRQFRLTCRCIFNNERIEDRIVTNISVRECSMEVGSHTEIVDVLGGNCMNA